MNGQLWIPASETFALPGFAGRPLKSRWAAPNLRALFWPSGAICWQFNLYLIHLRRHGLSVSTVNTYASEMSVYLRFLWEQKLNVADVDDDVLIDFADNLVLHGKSGNHVNRILLCVLRYYTWYQTVFPDAHLVGAPGSGCKISLTRQVVRTKIGGISGKVKHISMVPPSVPSTVRPISFESISKLISACDDVGKTRFKRCRDRCIVTLMADSGIRREELTWLRCDNVRFAMVNGNKIRVRTSKRKGNPEREIPLPSETVAMLIEYIDVARAMKIRRLTSENSSFADDGWLFCTISGAKIAPVTISQIFADLKNASQTLGGASPHMLRHRYITLQVVARIRAMRKKNIGLEALTTILSRVASLSGHGSLQSLWTYVDWAFDELDSSSKRSEIEKNSILDLVKLLIVESKNEGSKKLLVGLEQLEHALLKNQEAIASATVLSHSFRKG